MSPATLAEITKKKARELGFSLVGVSAPLSSRRSAFYEWWVDQGFGAEMFYLRSQKKRRRNLNAVLPGAKSVVVCAMQFPLGPDSTPADVNERAYGKVARYALHEDYHNTLLPKLKELGVFIDAVAKCAEPSLAYVDTGPVSERAYAAAAGLGWVGKNSLLINREIGSWFWLGEIITQAELTPDAPVADHCGKCRRCLDACPTGAIFEEIRALDSKKCLAYLNIEKRGEIPPEFHKPMGNWLLGCDICQEVCPWNGHAERGLGESPPPEWIAVDEILALDKEKFVSRYQGRAHSRAKLAGLQRNAKIVQENFLRPKESFPSPASLERTSDPKSASQRDKDTP